MPSGTCVSRATNGCSGSSGVSRTSTLQYSTGVNARISRSRSTINRTATDCTRPADRPAPHPPPQDRRDPVADQTVQDAPGLLRVEQLQVDAARSKEGVEDRVAGDLGEGHPLGRGGILAEQRGDVEGDRLPLAVVVGREDQVVGVLEGALQIADVALRVLGDLVLHLELVVDVDAELRLRRSRRCPYDARTA